jgi:SAM-dependent methyltransferase
MQYIALVGNVEDEVLECFYRGGGVHPSRYPRFQQLQAEETSRIFDAALISDILPMAPGLVERLEAGIDVADVGCGSGHAINLMAKAFPKSRFIGLDLSENGIAAARAEAEQLGLTNARFEVRDAATLDTPRQYDLITAFDSIPDQSQPTQVLENIAQALQPDGVFLMQDITASSNLEENLEHPLGPMLYSASVLYCMTVSLAFNGEGFGTMWGGQKARQKLVEAGFTRVEVKQLPSDILNSYYIARKG